MIIFYFLVSNCERIIELLSELKNEMELKFKNTKNYNDNNLIFKSQFLDPQTKHTYFDIENIKENNNYDTSVKNWHVFESISEFLAKNTISDPKKIENFYDLNGTVIEDIYFEFWIFKLHYESDRYIIEPLQNFLTNYFCFFEPKRLRVNLFFKIQNNEDMILLDETLYKKIVNAYEWLDKNNMGDLSLMINNYNLETEEIETKFCVNQDLKNYKSYLNDLNNFLENILRDTFICCIIDDYVESTNDLYFYIQDFMMQQFNNPINNKIFFSLKDYYSSLNYNSNSESSWLKKLIEWLIDVKKESNFSILHHYNHAHDQFKSTSNKKIGRCSLFYNSYNEFFISKANQEMPNWEKYNFYFKINKKEICVFQKATPKTQLEDNIHKYFAKLDSEKDFKRIKLICKIMDIIYCNMTIIYYSKLVTKNLVKGFIIFIDETRHNNDLEKIIAAFYYNYNEFELQKNNNDFLNITKIFQNLKKYILDFVDENRLEFVKQHLLSIDSYSRNDIYYKIDHESYKNLSFGDFIWMCIHNLKIKHPEAGKIKLFTCILNRTDQNFSKGNEDTKETYDSDENFNKALSDANELMLKLFKTNHLSEVNGVKKSKKILIEIKDEISIESSQSYNDNHKSLSLELSTSLSSEDKTFFKKFIEKNSKIYIKSNCSDFCVVIENENKTKEILFYIPCFENLINFTNLPLFEIKKDFIDYVNIELNKLSVGTNEAKKELFSIYNFFFKQANYAEIYQVLISPDYFFDLAFSHLKFKLFDFCTDYNKNKDIKEKDFLAKFRVDQYGILCCAARNCYNFYDFCMVSLLDHETCNFLYQLTNEYISLIKTKKKEFLSRIYQNNQGYLITYIKN